MFDVIWCCRTQSYTVYKNGIFLRTTYDRKAANSYLETGVSPCLSIK